MEAKRYIDSVMDDEAIDFSSLNLLDFETAEKERIEARRLLESKYKEQTSFTTKLTVIS